MIQKLINDKLLAEQNKRKDRVRSGMWSPSSFGRCYRLQYWNRKNEPQSNPPDERALRVFKVGHFFHDFVETIIKDQHPQAETEVLVKKDDVLGFADIVLPDEVIDIKSQHSKSFWYMEKVGEVIYASGVPQEWAEMSPADAGRNAAKMMLYYAIRRCRTKREKQRAIALYNSYCFGYALGMNYRNSKGQREMLWPVDLDEILVNGCTKHGNRFY